MRVIDMQDRELLELAARAADIEVRWTDQDFYRGSFLRRVVPKPEEPCSEWLYWRPLHDDGDALRLVVKLRMSIEPSVGHCAVAFDDQKGDVGLVEQDDGEEGLLTDSEIVRRAIVCAAAEIGRSIPC